MANKIYYYVVGKVNRREVWRSESNLTKRQAQRVLAYLQSRVEDGLESPLLRYSICETKQKRS